MRYRNLGGRAYLQISFRTISTQRAGKLTPEHRKKFNTKASKKAAEARTRKARAKKARKGKN